VALEPIRWRSLEKAVASRMRQEIRAHILATQHAHSALRAAIMMVNSARASAGKKARAVQTRLLVRISSDLRTVEWTSVNGYILQAMTLAGSVHELSHIVAFIGNDDAKADDWEKHALLGDTYPSIRKRKATLRVSLQALGFTGDALEDEFNNQENNYRHFCAAKHGNPMFLRDWGCITHNGQESVIHGPFYEERTPVQARQILYASTRVVWLATGVYTFPWYESARGPARERFRRRLRRLESSLWKARWAPRNPPSRAD
jgi:hypothetical protein